ncbi:MAG: Bax inhibitor-1 family protein [Thermicanus sp.]|nr:Bax inhibitor-1 family protein [Thermicanus sp.]
MENVLVNRNAGSFGNILQVLALSLLVSFGGTLIGAFFIPPAFASMLGIVELIMIIAAVVIRIRGKFIGYGFLYAFTGISGITLYPIIMYYGAQMGANLVSASFLATAGIFAALSFYAYRSARDFSYLLGFLFAGTIGLIIMGLAALFIDIGGTLNLVWAVGGILIFSGWILYDVSQYRNGVDEREVPFVVLNLYLDIVNLFLYILRFVAAITGSRD